MIWTRRGHAEKAQIIDEALEFLLDDPLGTVGHADPRLWSRLEQLLLRVRSERLPVGFERPDGGTE